MKKLAILCLPLVLWGGRNVLASEPLPIPSACEPVLPIPANVDPQSYNDPGRWRIGPYVVEICTSHSVEDAGIHPVDDHFAIWRDGRIIEEDEGLEYSLAGVPGQSLSGGPPHLVVNSFGGRYWETRVYEMGERPKTIWKSRASETVPEFSQLDKDPALEIQHTSPGFGQIDTFSLAPKIILKYAPATQTWVLAPALMRKPMTLADAQRLAAMKADGGWATLADLYFTGNARLARPFFNSTRLSAEYGKPKAEALYWEITNCRLRASPYWPDIAKMNGLAAAPPDQACPKI